MTCKRCGRGTIGRNAWCVCGAGENIDDLDFVVPHVYQCCGQQFTEAKYLRSHEARDHRKARL